MIIKRIRNKKRVYFGPGSFDNYCVFVSDDYGRKEALKDNQYFSYFKSIQNEYEKDKIYDDFITIYESTTRDIDVKVREIIDFIVTTYKPEHQVDVEMYFTVMYGGMIAELCKENTVLGKRIKLLGVHQVLKEDIDPDIAANFSRNKNWIELDSEMKKRGI